MIEITQNKERGKNVLVYVNEGQLDHLMDSTMYFVRECVGMTDFNIKVQKKYNEESVKWADVIMNRINPPLNMEVINGLKKYENDSGKLFINPPSAQEYFSNKRYLKDLSSLGVLSPTLVSSDLDEIRRFLWDYNHAILKPCESYGGKGIVEIPLTCKNLEGKILDATFNGKREIIAQKFIEGIREYGDKRIHLVNGNPVGAVLRIPADGEFVCCVSSGASSVPTEITKSDYEIIEKISPLLKEKKVFWAGIDVIGPYLGEINAISPGLLARCDKFGTGMGTRDSGMKYLINEIKNYEGFRK